MTKCSLILLAFLAFSSVSDASNSYLIIAPNLYKVGCANHLSVYFPSLAQVVQVDVQLRVQQELVQVKATYQAGESSNVTLTLPEDFPVGAGQLLLVGTGGVHFEERREVIIYDNRHLLLVQTSASTYQPQDTMEIRVVATNELLLPIAHGFLSLEIYDAALKLVGHFPRVPIHAGLTETVRYPLAEHLNAGTWLVSAVLQNTTTSVPVLVSRPITPLFDLKAYFPRYLLRSERVLRGAIELSDDQNEPSVGRVNISISALTEQSTATPTGQTRQMDIAGRLEFHDDLLAMFEIDLSQALALQITVEALELASGHERTLRHLIPIFNREILYDLRPLEFQAGLPNEFEILARRPDGKPSRMENLLVSVRMTLGERHEEQSVEITDFYSRGRNDLAFFKLEIPEDCLAVMVSLSPNVQGYRTQSIPLLPTPRRRGEKLTIELLPAKAAPAHTDVNVPVVSSQISTVGRLSHFYVQLLPSKAMKLIERLPLSYLIISNGRMIRTGEMTIEPSRECRDIRPEEPAPPTCLYNGTLPIEITHEMIPYSTLIIYGFQLPLGYHVLESYRFSVAGLFQSSLTLNATNVPRSPAEPELDDHTRLELSITGTSDALLGLHVLEYDAVLDSLANEITKERLLQYLTNYEQVPFGDFAAKLLAKRTLSEEDEQKAIHREELAYQARYPVEKMAFGLSSARPLSPVEGDDVYTTSQMAKLYNPPSAANYRRKYQKVADQYDVTVEKNDYVVATSLPKPTPNDTTTPIPLPFARMSQLASQYSQEAFALLRSGLAIISDFDSLTLPAEVRTANFTQFFSRFASPSLANLRDQSRQLLETYVMQTGGSLLPPPVLLDEHSRATYARSLYFNQTTLNAQGQAKVLLPQLKPFSSWLATGFSLHPKSGLAIAQPIRLPTDQGLYLLANCPKQARVDEQLLLTFAAHNYLEKDLANVQIRIRASQDFALFNASKSLNIEQQDFQMTVPTMKPWEVLIEQLVVVPKRAGLLEIFLELRSAFGGDRETLTLLVRDAAIVEQQLTTRLYDLTTGPHTYGPIVEPLNSSEIHFSVSGTGLAHLLHPFTSLVGIDQALVRLYRSLAFRHYLNETSQTDTPLYQTTATNITSAFQSLQVFHDGNGSYSSLLLTSLACGAMLSPYMPVRDHVTLNRTLAWILSQQHADGSFDDPRSCYHERFCAGKFRRESLTALFLYALTHENISETTPALRHPLARAQDYLISRVPAVISNYLTISLFEMAFIQNHSISPILREKIHQAVLSRELLVHPSDHSQSLKSPGEETNFADRILLHAMTSSLYSYFGDFRTSWQLSQWLVAQPVSDTVLAGVFVTDAWLRNSLLFRERFPVEKCAVHVRVKTANAIEQHFQINASNLDLSQSIQLDGSTRELSYSVEGFGILGVLLRQVLRREQPDTARQLPFELTQHFQPTPWLKEIQAKTCMTYTPRTDEDQTSNRTIVVQVELPSGTRVNLRQIGFFLSRNAQLLFFNHDSQLNTLSFFLNVPASLFGKAICFDWALERLSTVIHWSAMPIHVYDYLQPERRLTRLEKISFQPQVLGYSFVQAGKA